jgi:hypothetical protein
MHYRDEDLKINQDKDYLIGAGNELISEMDVFVNVIVMLFRS